MTDILISQLPMASSINSTDLIILDQTSNNVIATKIASVSQLVSFIGASNAPTYLQDVNSNQRVVATTTGATVSGNLSLTGVLTSTIGAGTAPFTVSSTTPVSNLSIGGTSALATSMVGGLGGQVNYQSAVNTTTHLPNGTSGQVLTSNGTTLAPSWTTFSSSAVWGAITGTLSSQTDLNTALGLKSPINNPTFTGAATSPSFVATSTITSIGNISSSTGSVTAAGAMSAGTTLTVGSGTTGIILQADTDGLSAAIYNTSVTPSNTNWAFKSTGAFSSIGGSSGSVLTANTANIVLATSTGAAVAGTLSATGNISVGSTPKVIIGATPPTIASGFGTSPTITAFSTAAFKVVVGTSPTGVGVLTFPTASTGWSCDVQNNTSNSTIVVGQTATTITSASFAAYSRTTGLAVNFNAGDVLTFTCMGF